MDDKEIATLFTGYGYQPRVVDDLDDIDADLNNSMEWALGEIKRIQQAARSGKPIMKPRWPVLVLRTPKGWSGPKKVHGEFVEGSFRAHQVPLAAAKSNQGELKELQKWLTSYKPEELFKDDGDVIDEIKAVIPENSEKRLGQKRESYAGYQPLTRTEWKQFTVKAGSSASSMQVVGKFLEQVVRDNPKSFRIFSPDEFESNKLVSLAGRLMMESDLIADERRLRFSTPPSAICSGTSSRMREAVVSLKLCLNISVRASCKVTH